MKDSGVSSGKAAGDKTRRIWRIGTLVYSFAGLTVLFAWLFAGDFVWNVRERAITPLAQIMLKNGGASDTIVALLVGSLPAALGMLVSPIIALKSDHYRSRLGRRIPFLIFSTPVAVVAMVGLAFAPLAGEKIHLYLGEYSPGNVICFLAFFSVSWLFFEVATIISNNLFLALINDVVPREVLGRFFGLFRAVGLGVAIGFNYFLFGKAESHMTIMLLSIAVLYGVGFMLMCLRVKEGDYPPVQSVKNQERFFTSATQFFRDCFRDPYYRWLFAAIAIAMAAFAPVNTFSIFYAKSVGLSLEEYGKVLAAAFLVSLLISYPIGALADKIHPLRVAVGSILVYIPLSLFSGLFASTPETYAGAFFMHVVVSGIYFTGTASLGQRLFPQQKFAQFASAGQIVMGICSMAITPFVGIILDSSGHYYQLTFYIAGVLSVFSVGGFCVVLAIFKKLGGDTNYSPPMS